MAWLVNGRARVQVLVHPQSLHWPPPGATLQGSHGCYLPVVPALPLKFGVVTSLVLAK